MCSGCGPEQGPQLDEWINMIVMLQLEWLWIVPNQRQPFEPKATLSCHGWEASDKGWVWSHWFEEVEVEALGWPTLPQPQAQCTLTMMRLMRTSGTSLLSCELQILFQGL